ncbi:hypothetical protein Trydic_g20520 [Trypoxylus dichotomus]
MKQSEEGESVTVRNMDTNQWEAAQVVRNCDMPRSYIVRTNDREYRRNRIHSRESTREPPKSSPYIDVTLSFDPTTSSPNMTDSNNTMSQSESIGNIKNSIVNSRPQRNVKEPARPLSDNEELVLAKGLNYAISPKSIPKEGTIAEVESSKRPLPSVIPDQIRFETAKCLISAKPPRLNLTHEESKALNNLRSDSDYNPSD